MVKKGLSEEVIFEQRTWSKKENELCDHCQGSSRCRGPEARMSMMCSRTAKSQCGWSTASGAGVGGGRKWGTERGEGGVGGKA